MKKPKLILNGDQDWKIWFTKFGKGIGLAIGAAGIAYAASYLQDNPLPDPKYQFIAGLLVVILIQIGNYIKHA